MSSSDKHKHKTLILSAKTDIITKYGKGEKLINLAKEYCVGRSAIYDVRENRRLSVL
jgi:hypothetical protein